jgi:hypothetical protein
MKRLLALFAGLVLGWIQKAAKMPVHVLLSGRTMEFDGSGRCLSGC